MSKNTHMDSISTKKQNSPPPEEYESYQLYLHSCLKLEGQRKVVDYAFLQVNILKIICLGVPFILSLVGLYCLIKCKSFRSKVFFSSHHTFLPDVTTHILAKTNDGSQEIQSIAKKKYLSKDYYSFANQLLNYMIIEGRIFPVGSNQRDRIELFLNSKSPLSCGVSGSSFAEKLSFFGKNEHKVEVPNYFFFMFQTLTEPLFMLQYFIFWIWAMQKLYQDIAGNLIFLIVLLSVNYAIRYYNFAKIKKIAQKQYSVKAVRDGEFTDISKRHIVPGDIYLVEKEIPCDSVLLTGDTLVNQANFTGQNIPILKVKIENIQQLKQSNHWINEGSELLKVKEGTLAMAMYTGFTSHKGRILRKIVKQSVKEPQFTHKILIFFLFAYLSAVIVYLTYLSNLQARLIRQNVVILVLFELVSLAVPIGYIGAVTFFSGISLVKLQWEGISGQAPDKVYESARLKTVCFDKTGTLTDNNLKLSAIYTYSKNKCMKTSLEECLDELTSWLFACCNMAKQTQEKLVGDEVDLKMFQHSQAKLLDSSSSQALWEVGISDDIFQVLRINQFESKFKSMSVLVRNKKSQDVFVFAKGSPELINDKSENRREEVARMIADLSLQGFRVIGFGYKRVADSHVLSYLSCPREEFLEGLKMLGLVTFINQLKPQAEKCIQRLREEVSVSVKMITGDNIFTAVKTGFMSGIIAQTQTVLICEGAYSQNFQAKCLKCNGDGQFEQIILKVENLDYFLVAMPQNVVIAVQDSFLDKSIFEKDLIEKVKVFARVSPQHKTQIIKSLVQLFEEEFEQTNYCQRFFGNSRSSVCMVGDGANDLMAIKEADVGISLSNSEGSLSADFVISKLHQIENIIREGKSISSILVQSLMMLFISNWLYIPLALLAMLDLCTFSKTTMLYNNMAFILPLPLLLGFCRSSSKNTSTTPVINILAPRHQLIMWVHNFIFTIAFICCFEIYWTSKEYQPNKRGWVSMAEGFTTHSKQSTLCFILTFSHCLIVILNLFQRDPWKKQITDNLPLTIYLAFNISSIYFLYFHQGWLQFLGLEVIGQKLSAKVLVVMIGTFGVSRIITTLINRYYEGLTESAIQRK